MSRSYRLKVRETLRKVIRAEDHVSSQLELLEILPCDQMAELLRQGKQPGFGGIGRGRRYVSGPGTRSDFPEEVRPARRRPGIDGQLGPVVGRPEPSRRLEA